MTKVRKYDELGREKIREYLKDCKIIYDLGCNTDTITKNAIGVDNGLHMTKEQLKKVNIICDLNLCFHCDGDGICASHLLEHIIDTRKFLRCCYESLTEKGRIAITVPDGETVNPLNLGDSSNTHEMLFTPKTLKLYLENAGFKNVKSEYYERPNAYKKTKAIFACGEKK
jgi:predicted SAM-dependent methyltransferase